MPKVQLPLIPIRDLVIFPNAVVPISIKRSRSVQALEDALVKEKKVVLVTQKKENVDSPFPEDLYSVGTIASVTQVHRLPDDVITVLVSGEKRVQIIKYAKLEPFFKVEVEEISETYISDPETDSLLHTVVEQFKQCVALGKAVSVETAPAIFDLSDPVRTIDLITFNLDLKTSEKQQLLEALDFRSRLEKISEFLAREISILQAARQIQEKTSEEIGKMAKEAFLREQLKTIEKELGIKEEREEFADLEKQIKAAKMPKDAEERAFKELGRLKKMPPFSPEISYIRTYLDWLVSLPWSKKSESEINIKAAEKTLNEDHYGLNKIKERILEYLAVQKLAGKGRGQIICFAGPPGVGKTSLGKSIAKALGRNFVRMSLGGVRDEAEIRGHRRTYVGALPGRIIQGIKNAGTKNPVFMLDEIDKVGTDFRGDPSSALLEALDPEQNNAFSDHYLEVPFDLSDVMFITTANMLDTIPPALLDRMEVISFPGYTEEEKLHIANDYLLPKQIEAHGLKKSQLKVPEETLKALISRYTREAGVRNLEREIATICRKVAKEIAEDGMKSTKVETTDLKKYLGPTRFESWAIEKKDEVGVAAGLAWTESGGEVLSVEATLMPGKGNLILTGHLGDVMKESATAALSYARSKVSDWKVPEDFYSNKDIHVHVPSGAIPKDGPSAGITMATALISAITKAPVRRELGMTGEITLRGKVLEIGGVKEKVLAAHRAGLTTLLLPKRNEKDLEEIPAKTRKDIKFYFVETMDEVLNHALTHSPTSN
ncbi:MAG: endopeptidase La [Patescibacteria group bacterium]|nr:endopeptidase La [Patescibacteria group bacterium]